MGAARGPDPGKLCIGSGGAQGGFGEPGHWGTVPDKLGNVRIGGCQRPLEASWARAALAGGSALGWGAPHSAVLEQDPGTFSSAPFFFLCSSPRSACMAPAASHSVPWCPLRGSSERRRKPMCCSPPRCGSRPTCFSSPHPLLSLFCPFWPLEHVSLITACEA